jgi:hypothetical protein
VRGAGGKEVFVMIDARSRRTAASGRRDTLLTGKVAAHDAESQAAAALRPGEDGEGKGLPRRRERAGLPAIVDRSEARARRVAEEIVRSVEARLPSRIRELRVRVEDDQFVLSGVSSSYYVKQIAQHVAMNALNALMLGRLVNEIKVHSMR